MATKNGGNFASTFDTRQKRPLLWQSGQKSVSTLAGNWRYFGPRVDQADGIGMHALFNSPSGMTADRAGNLQVADTGNHTVRNITIVRNHALNKEDLNDDEDNTNAREHEQGGCLI